MVQDITPQEAIKRLEQQFGDRVGMLTHTLTLLSTSGQPTDVTFYKRKPILDVRVSSKLGAARLYGLEDHVPRVLTSRASMVVSIRSSLPTIFA